jgi:hypothetical protein
MPHWHRSRAGSIGTSPLISAASRNARSRDED